MSEAINSEGKKRGVGFPSMSLRDAVEAIVRAGQKGGAEHSQNAFATYLGHATANSGPYRAKLASMRDWGLIARGNDRVVFTALAKDFLKAAPNHLDATDLLSQAFLNCSTFAALYEDSAHGVVVDRSRLRTAAMIDIGINSDTADKFVESFIESCVAARLGEAMDNGIRLGAVDTMEEPTSDAGSVSGPATTVDRVVSLADSGRAADALAVRPNPVAEPRVALQQTWEFAEGTVEFVVRSDDALPASAYVLIGEIVERLSKLVKALDLPANQEPE